MVLSNSPETASSRGRPPLSPRDGVDPAVTTRGAPPDYRLVSQVTPAVSRTRHEKA